VSETARYIGRALPRLEDARLVAGAGRYTDDIHLPGEVHAAFVRSPHAHAAIRAIDAAAARAMPGVLAVLTGADYRAAGLAGIRQLPIPADVIDHRLKAFGPDSVRPPFDTPQWPLAVDRVRHVGEPLAVVIAATLDAARDAAALVDVDYDSLPAVTDACDALAPGAPALHEAVPDNLALDTEFGGRDATEAAFAAADVIVEHTFRNQRIVNAQMEPRAALGHYDQAADRYTLTSGNQGVHRQKIALAECLGVAPERVRVICPDVGGAFGLRTNLYPEQLVVVWAARHVGRPVHWTGDRSECFLTDLQGRDLVTTARLALDRTGRILALAADMLGNVGAHPVSYVPLNNGYRIMTTVYDIPAAHVRIRAAFTNTMPVATYRGAGRPEAHFVLERLIDIAAARLGIDRLEIRQRNLVRGQLPYRTAMGLTYDSGDFSGNMARAVALADWHGVAARKAAARARARRVGIGIASYVEAPVGAPHERVRLEVRDGAVAVHAGTQSTGQGHETTFAQVLADRLGIAPHLIRLVTGDSDALPSGGGSHSDRSMRLAGALLMDTSGQVVAQARKIFAALAAVDETDVSFDDGTFGTPRSNLRLTLFDIARAIEADPSLPPGLRKPLTAEATFTGRMPAHPTGCAVCEVELDPETGAIEVTRYASVDDAGQPINPLVLHGQVHGGIVQGLGQALGETVAWDSAGQVLNASFMDYAMPRADWVPSFDVALSEDPTGGNALRVKGGGEAGITPALAAAMNAVVDALAEYGVAHIEMPATPARVWEALRAATPERPR
jgi:carbon-monoxide dehydrogenase large subunit